MALKAKPTPSKMVKGVTRKEWCRQILKIKRKITPERLEQLRQQIKKGRLKQQVMNGALFGKVNPAVLRQREREALVHKPDRFWHCEEYRQAIC